MKARLKLAEEASADAPELLLEIENDAADPITFNERRFRRIGGRTDLALIQDGRYLEADEFMVATGSHEEAHETIAPGSTLTLRIPIEIDRGHAFAVLRFLGAGYRVERRDIVHVRLTWPEAADLASVPIKVS